MDWLLKHSLIKQYLQTNFKQREFKKAIKYTLIIGIQTLYQLHGNSATNPFESFSLEQLAAMIISNNGILQVQSDLPELNKCLKDIKTQLGSIQNELAETQNDTPSRTIESSVTTSKSSNAQKFVQNLVSNPSKRSQSSKPKGSKKTIPSKVAKTSNPLKTKVRKKSDSKWRDGDSQKFKPSAVYPKWWPEDDVEDEHHYDHQCPDQENQGNNAVADTVHDEQQAFPEETQSRDVHIPSHVEQPHIYKQPVAFSVPTNQLKDENVVQLHVNLYPEYLQKCLDPNSIQKVNNPESEDHGDPQQLDQRHRPHPKGSKHSKTNQRTKNRSKSLTRCTESSHARTSGVRSRSDFLKSQRRNIAPCLKYAKPQRSSSRPQTAKTKRRQSANERRKSLPNANKEGSSDCAVPKYLRNVTSRIKGELKRDKQRNQKMQSQKESAIRNIARYGLHDDEHDAEEWTQRFGYSRIGMNEITKPTAISVADAMMQSDLIQAMDPSFNKRPALMAQGNAKRTRLVESGLNDGDDRAESRDQGTTESLYERIRRGSHLMERTGTGSPKNDGVNMSFVTDLREWAAGLSSDYPHTRSMDTEETK